MPIDRSGVPFLVAAAIPAVALVVLDLLWWAVPFVIVSGVFLFFFRDPPRHPPRAKGLVLAPADGRILVAGEVVSGDPPEGTWWQVSIFLSPIDVHINRVPIGGEVTHVHRQSGKFLAAYRSEASSSNERTEVAFRHNDVVIVCRQIVGVLARRIVCRVSVGHEVQAGDRFGIMKFGSRIDLFIPRTATIAVVPGQRVRGGESVVARLPGYEKPEGGL
ncbi:MAG TPA: phosphatidylserine decarboxylase family protein [Acidobacteria bacterium]|nr:phosphatidylserine decarboxylase family protein [Acidobacteriota bacterium]